MILNGLDLLLTCLRVSSQQQNKQIKVQTVRVKSAGTRQMASVYEYNNFKVTIPRLDLQNNDSMVTCLTHPYLSD